MGKTRQEGPHGNPNFFEYLSPDDKIAYEKLRKDLGDPNNRYNRNHSIMTLKNNLDKIRAYCQGKEEEKMIKYLVCGICWLKDYLAINNSRLRFLLSKSKSSLNDSLLKMGYLTVTSNDEPKQLLLEEIKYLGENSHELRKWSIHKLKAPKTKNCTVQNENECILEEDIYNEDINFIDNFNDNTDTNQNKTDDEFGFVDCNDNVSENFDFNFGFDIESTPSQNCNSCDENFLIMNNIVNIIDNNFVFS